MNCGNNATEFCSRMKINGLTKAMFIDADEFLK